MRQPGALLPLPDKAGIALPHAAQTPTPTTQPTPDTDNNFDSDIDTDSDNENDNDADYQLPQQLLLRLRCCISSCVFPRHLPKFPALLATFLHG